MTCEVKGSASWRNSVIENWNHGRGADFFFPWRSECSKGVSSSWETIAGCRYWKKRKRKTGAEREGMSQEKLMDKERTDNCACFSCVHMICQNSTKWLAITTAAVSPCTLVVSSAEWWRAEERGAFRGWEGSLFGKPPRSDHNRRWSMIDDHLDYGGICILKSYFCPSKSKASPVAISASCESDVVVPSKLLFDKGYLSTWAICRPAWKSDPHSGHCTQTRWTVDGYYNSAVKAWS